MRWRPMICYKGESGLGNGKYGNSVSNEFDRDTESYGGWKAAFDHPTLHNGMKDHEEIKRDWEDFSDTFGQNVSDSDLDKIMGKFTSDGSVGYVRTANSFNINQKLYDEKNANKTDEEIFTRTGKKGDKVDLETVRSLDRAIASGRTPSNAVYTRFVRYDAVQATYKFNDDQMRLLKNADIMSDSELRTLNDSMRGKVAYSRSYTSASGNRSLNVFQGKPVERKLYIPKGTNAFAARKNSEESEVVFGRNMNTELIGITISKQGHVVLHERFVGYKKH